MMVGLTNARIPLAVEPAFTRLAPSEAATNTRPIKVTAASPVNEKKLCHSRRISVNEFPMNAAVPKLFVFLKPCVNRFSVRWDDYHIHRNNESILFSLGGHTAALAANTS